ncbi:hypothetical protein F5X99DRAFT_410214 [Biscogniauxia marginata]|nr:hypothetical protein F5X99DRAFT_410214 [Biscogniauxia marginata]
MADKYADSMTRHDSDIKRLDAQFDLMTENIGYLHPAIVPALSNIQSFKAKGLK